MALTLVVAGIRRPQRAIALLVLLASTPWERPELSTSAQGQTLRHYFRRCCLGFVPLNALCRGVLILPSQHADYLRGRRRQAVRTNLRRASQAGMTCEAVGDRVEAATYLLELEDGRGIRIPLGHTDRWQATVAAPETSLFVARDGGGRVVAVAGVVIDNAICLLRCALANDHDARWALHDHLVRTLIDRRVRYLVADGGGAFGALGSAAGVQHHQHLLGYELRHIRPRCAPTPHGRRGAVPSAVMLAATIALLALVRVIPL